MPDINTELTAIKSAVYGEEVRGSIISALKKMIDTVNSLNVDDILRAIETLGTLTEEVRAATTAAQTATQRAEAVASGDIGERHVNYEIVDHYTEPESGAPIREILNNLVYAANTVSSLKTLIGDVGFDKPTITGAINSLQQHNVLWSGNELLGQGTEINLSQNISDQNIGVVLVFSHRSGTAADNYNYDTYFIHKDLVRMHNGGGHSLANFHTGMSRYVYVHDNKLVGNDRNTTSGTVGNVTFNNNITTLRYVIGV